MESTILFSQYNAEQKPLVEIIIKDFAETLSRATDLDNILDVGCGAGDVTKSILLPYFNNCQSIVGIDISEEAVRFAREHHHHDKIVHEVLDIEGDIRSFKEKWGSFSHVVSFLCLHWVNDWNKTFSNISQLLSQNGVCLLYFITTNNVHKAWLMMSKSKKWNQYMKDIGDIFVCMQDSWDPHRECQRLVNQNEMLLLKCEAIDHEVWIDDIDYLKALLRCLDRFISRIPNEEQELYIQDLVNCLSMIPNSKINVDGKTKYLIETKRIVLWARRVMNVVK